jgi:hypothetical protein
MGKILELQSFFTAGACAAETALVANIGDSLVVKNGKEGSAIKNLAMWGHISAGAGTMQVLSPLLHDSTRAWRFRITALDPENVIPHGLALPLHAQDPLTASCLLVGGAATPQILSMLNYYEDFENVQANLITYESLLARIKQLTTVEATITATVLGQYSGAQLITAVTDLLHANTEYAIIGAQVGANCGSLVITAPDFANMRVGIPGNAADKEMTANFFANIARHTGLPVVPVFNSANDGNIWISITQSVLATVVPFNLILAELNPA